MGPDVISTLFAEEVGIVLEVADRHFADVVAAYAAAKVCTCSNKPSAEHERWCGV